MHSLKEYYQMLDFREVFLCNNDNAPVAKGTHFKAVILKEKIFSIYQTNSCFGEDYFFPSVAVVKDLLTTDSFLSSPSFQQKSIREQIIEWKLRFP